MMKKKICLDCLFILCENPKTTELINELEFDLIRTYLQMNIDNGSTSFRNQSLSLLKKHFIRIKDSWLFCARQKLKKADQDYDRITESYRVRIHFIVDRKQKHMLIFEELFEMVIKLVLFSFTFGRIVCSTTFMYFNLSLVN